MHTTRLWTSAEFSATRRCSLCLPPKPIDAMAAVASSSSHALKAGSLHARATTWAPLCGPTCVSYTSTSASTAAASTRPLSTSSDSSALTRSSSSDGGSVWSWS